MVLRSLDHTHTSLFPPLSLPYATPGPAKENGALPPQSSPSLPPAVTQTARLLGGLRHAPRCLCAYAVRSVILVKGTPCSEPCAAAVAGTTRVSTGSPFLAPPLRPRRPRRPRRPPRPPALQDRHQKSRSNYRSSVCLPLKKLPACDGRPPAASRSCLTRAGSAGTCLGVPSGPTKDSTRVPSLPPLPPLRPLRRLLPAPDCHCRGAYCLASGAPSPSLSASRFPCFPPRRPYRPYRRQRTH